MNHTHKLPSKPSLRNLKVQAKSLLKAYREDDPDAVRIFQHIASSEDSGKWGLSEAQFSLAMDYGFSCWGELRDFVIAQELLRNNESAHGEEHILHDMHKANGKWENDGDDRMSVHYDGPSSTLISDKAYPGDALTVEVLARPEVETQWGMHFQCLMTPYDNVVDLYDAIKQRGAEASREAIWRISCGRREKDVWSSILYNQAGRWSRDINCYEGFSSFNGSAGHWYKLKAERLGHMLRLWVNDVPIFESRDPRPVPESVHVWIASVCCNVRFRDVKVYRPADAYIGRYSKPVTLFDPYAQKREILARYSGKVLHEAEIRFGGKPEENGLLCLSDRDGKNRTEKIGDVMYCRAECDQENLPFLSFKLENPQQWNCDNVIHLEIDYLDDRRGDLGVFYRTWHYDDTPTPDHRMMGDGKMKKLVLTDLRDPLFGASGNQNGGDISITTVHPVLPGPAVHGVRLIEEEKPREAYEEVLRTFDQEIDRRGDEWTVGHYLFHKALVLRFNMSRPKQADDIMQQVGVRWPDCECVNLYKAMCSAKRKRNGG